ncbi:peroxiredoxin-like family protein [Urechidicola sp. KH5]
MKKFTFVLLFLFLVGQQSFSQVATSANDIKPLKSGEFIPNVSLRTINGDEVELSKIIINQRTVLVFYRGGWCPFCTAHLAALAEAEEQIKNLGFQIIGVSADSPEMLKKSIDKKELNYTLLSDSSTEAIQAFGIAIEAPERYNKMLLKHSDNKNSHIIPVPAAYILDTNGRILYDYVNPDFKKRISEEELISELKSVLK